MDLFKTKEKLKNLVRKLIREPLLHFLLLGIAIFILYDLAGNKSPQPNNKVITVSPTMVENMINRWMLRMNRPPNEAELMTMVEGYIDEEILYREALLLELDEQDVVIRRRLAQKMEFISRQVLTAEAPTHVEILSFFEATRDEYRLEASISFSHIYLNVDRRSESEARSLALQLKNDLNTMDPIPYSASGMGDRFMPGNVQSLTSVREIAMKFGSDRFADTLLTFQTGKWEGPISSPFGLHVVNVSEIEEGRIPELDEVVDQVRQDLIDVRKKELDEAFRIQLRSRYKIKFDDYLIDEYSENEDTNTARL